MSRRLYEKTPSPKKFKLVLGGGHNNSARVDIAEYVNTGIQDHKTQTNTGFRIKSGMTKQ